MQTGDKKKAKIEAKRTKKIIENKEDVSEKQRLSFDIRNAISVSRQNNPF
jgi:hypothetical protein